MSLLSALSTELIDLESRKLQPVTVAVIDSGVDSTHPDLDGRIIRAFRVEKLEGDYKVIEGKVPDNDDVYGHGTAVSSIITGLAPNAEIIDIRVLDSRNLGQGDALVVGLEHALQLNAKVINMSLAAHGRFAPRLNELCETAYRKNRLVVAARRNMPLVDDGFPAEFSSCIGVDVGSFPSLFKLRFRENHAIEFIAHGEGISVAAPGGKYTTKTGTSLATPVVSGLCALLVGAFPDLRPFDVKSLLRQFADP
jgi:subtilisin family serine protease